MFTDLQFEAMHTVSGDNKVVAILLHRERMASGALGANICSDILGALGCEDELSFGALLSAAPTL